MHVRFSHFPQFQYLTEKNELVLIIMNLTTAYFNPYKLEQKPGQVRYISAVDSRVLSTLLARQEG